MWSHYADDHKGVVIGFDPAKLASKWLRVQYQDERVDIPFGLSGTSPDFHDAVARVISTKHTQWQYEHEHRCLLRLDRCKKQNIKGKDMHFIALRGGCVKEIVLGVRMSASDKTAIAGLPGASGASIVEAQIDLREFKIQLS